MNYYVIKLEKSNQPFFGLNYSRRPIKLETLKIYIKTNLVNGAIWLSKSLVREIILFDQKPDKNLHLCMDYWGLNNLTIKN